MILTVKKFLDKHKLDRVTIQLIPSNGICEVTFGEKSIEKTVRITYELLNDIYEQVADDYAVSYFEEIRKAG